MEQHQRIVMKCPKCQKDFPFDVNYCESCSAMLEPFEIDDKESAYSKSDKGSQSRNATTISHDKINDVKINFLKADIEDKLIYTLLCEIDMLKKRLTKQETSLNKLQDKRPDKEHSNFLSEIADKEKAVDETIKKITKLELTLDGLKKTIATDIENITSQINGIHKLYIFLPFTKTGRYYRMLCSELKSKNIFMDILLKKRPPAYFTLKRKKQIYLLVALSVVLTLIISWQFFKFRYNDFEIPPPATVSPPKTDNEKRMITENDIINLLDDIKKANLNEDLSLWETRYSRQYLELPDKKENILKQWRMLDYTSLDYTVSQLKTETDKAKALISWEMEYEIEKTKKRKSISLILDADFITENGKVKISSVEKQTQ